MEKLYRVMTGMSLAKLLEIDAFFLNEDRHANNIALLYNSRSGEYRLCPFFDMGLSLFADTFDSFPFSDNYEKCIRRIRRQSRLTAIATHSVPAANQTAPAPGKASATEAAWGGGRFPPLPPPHCT